MKTWHEGRRVALSFCFRTTVLVRRMGGRRVHTYDCDGLLRSFRLACAALLPSGFLLCELQGCYDVRVGG